MPLRIYDIAKKLGIENTEVLLKAKELGIAAARIPSSSLDKISAEWLEEEIIKSNPALAARLGVQTKRGLLSMSLGNFKAFAEAQAVPIRPLTLIFGANSSGKSSVIHGLLLAHEAVRTGKTDIFKTELGGESVDLGGFRQFVHRRRVAERVEWSAEFETKNLAGNAYLVLGKHEIFKVSLIFGMPLDDKGSPEKGKSPRLIYYDIEVGGQIILRFSKRDDGSMQLLRYDEQAIKPIALALLNASTSTAAKLASEVDMATITQTIEAVSAELRFECEGLLPERIPGQATGASSLSQWFAIPRSDRQKQLADATRTYFPRAILEFVKGVNNEVRKQLTKVLYLGPLRSCPPRHLAFLEDSDPNWMAGGGYAWDLVRTDVKLRESVNEWLGSPNRLKTRYRLEIERYFAASEIQTGLDTGFSEVAEDIAAQLLGENKPGEDQVARLLNHRSKLDSEQANLEADLERARAYLAGLEKQYAVTSRIHDETTANLEKKRLELQATIQPDDSENGEDEVTEKLSEEIERLADRLKNIEENFKFINDESHAETQKLKSLESQLEELLREKADIYSDITFNIDSEKNVERLFDEIMNRPERSSVDELILRDCRTDTRVSHRDVGIGVSQVLPVLVHAYADRGKVVAIEQPEIHLHPKMQAELGDLFIESALGQQANTFLLETHSEHLILRILRRVRETTEKRLPAGMTPIRPEDISVVYVDPTANGSVVKLLTVTPDGDFAEPWPDGFFTERLEDLP